MKTPKTSLEIQNFPKPREIEAATRKLLEEHYEQYKTHVHKANELLERTARADRNAADPVFSDLRLLKRELPVALAAVKGYELFLSQIGGHGGSPNGRLAEHLKKDFGSVEGFMEELLATGVASRGWVGLVYEPRLERLVVTLGDTPEHLATLQQWPLLALEVTSGAEAPASHAERRRLMQRLLEAVDWKAVSQKLEHGLEMRAAPNAS